jgi:hypothetical protein
MCVLKTQMISSTLKNALAYSDVVVIISEVRLGPDIFCGYFSKILGCKFISAEIGLCKIGPWLPSRRRTSRWSTAGGGTRTRRRRAARLRTKPFSSCWKQRRNNWSPVLQKHSVPELAEYDRPM